MQLPHWLSNREDDLVDRMSFLIRTAALHYSREGTIPALAIGIGCTPQAIYNAMYRGTMTPMMALSIESAVGKDVITKELLCPHVFK